MFRAYHEECITEGAGRRFEWEYLPSSVGERGQGLAVGIMRTVESGTGRAQPGWSSDNRGNSCITLL